jgi:hypothetical protein
VLTQYLSDERRRAILEASEKFQRLLEIELALCERPSLVGAGSHLQLVVRNE